MRADSSKATSAARSLARAQRRFPSSTRDCEAFTAGTRIISNATMIQTLALMLAGVVRVSTRALERKP